jgi:Domain of unknown function (DUF5666)
MRRMFLRVAFGIAAIGSVLSTGAAGQSTTPQVIPSQSVVSDPSASPASPEVAPVTESSATPTPSATSTPSIEILRPAPTPTPDATDVVIDPASLLPDLPKLPDAKASLIGGTVGRLDRVRDQITVQIFGGGKMKIFFDPRTHIYHDGAETSLADLHQGDHVYIETILDGSNVFARAIRLKTSTSAGESQGIITGYNDSKGELQLRDALSPQTIKIRITPQTRIVEGNRAASASRLAPGTLIAVKFGARKDGGEVASEVSVLAAPGDSFTFAGQVTAIDLRLGLMVLTSSTDHKTYEIYLDPSVLTIDESVRPSVDVTVLTRFEGNRYVARIITVNSPVQR